MTTTLEQTPVKGLPVWYFALVGMLVASVDISTQFRDEYPWTGFLPLAVAGVHFALWGGTLRRRRDYIRGIWRSRTAKVLVICLLAVRLGLQFGLTRLTDSMAPLHSYAHLIMGLAMLVLTSVGAWFDQWLILRTLNRKK